MPFRPTRQIQLLTILLCGTVLITQAEPIKPTRKKEKPRTHASPLVDNGAGMQRTREMENQLALFEHQFIKILPLNRDHLSQRSLLAQQYESDATMRATKLAQLDASYERAYRQVLTLRQAMLMEQARAEIAPDMNMGYFMMMHF
ncbi:hypothetical protein Q5H93_02565 [Hymenobacter sp. ASUV-10]|uniref:Periplasmic heavy metal sensor n=1 Tax=Hymenobacter aranciens TaxID=3063996 RepID=A0ABT9B5R0_9BACT|nr:hypothetical protein [Hymenobacter sp. ASUV-10]MDO7873600.1 hypothetical protein [Hymenobacter sp. ASUV-10]